MLYIQWRDELDAQLKDLPQSERQAILFKFADTYAQLRDSGLTEEQAVKKLGDPKRVAADALRDRQKCEKQAKTCDCRGNMPQPTPESAGKTGAAGDCFAVRLIFMLGAAAVLIGMIVAIVWLVCAPLGLIAGGAWTIVAALVADAAGAAWAHAGIAVAAGIVLAASGVLAIPLSILLIRVIVKTFKSLAAWLKDYSDGRAEA